MPEQKQFSGRAAIVTGATRGIGLAVAAAIFGGFSVREAVAANGAYAVDAADISEVGSCKVESWLSAATTPIFPRSPIHPAP